MSISVKIRIQQVRNSRVCSVQLYNVCPFYSSNQHPSTTFVHSQNGRQFIYRLFVHVKRIPCQFSNL